MLTFNRSALSVFGLAPTSISGWLRGARGRRTPQGIPGRTDLLVGTKQAAAARTIQVGVWANLAADTDRPGVIARAEYGLAAGRIAVATVDRPNVQTWAVLDDVDWRELDQRAPGSILPHMSGTLSFLALDGGSEDVEPSAPVFLSTTAVTLPSGTLPTSGHLLLWGTTSPLTITYTPANGNTALALVITQTVATGEHLAVDLARADVWLAATNGTRTKVTGITGSWPSFDPDDNIGLGLLDGTSATINATIALSTGSGLWIGRRRYRL